MISLAELGERNLGLIDPLWMEWLPAFLKPTPLHARVEYNSGYVDRRVVKLVVIELQLLPAGVDIGAEVVLEGGLVVRDIEDLASYIRLRSSE